MQTDGRTDRHNEANSGFLKCFYSVYKLISLKGRDVLSNLKADGTMKPEMTGHSLAPAKERQRYAISAVRRIVFSFATTNLCEIFFFATLTGICKTVQSGAPKLTNAEKRIAFSVTSQKH